MENIVPKTIIERTKVIWHIGAIDKKGNVYYYNEHGEILYYSFEYQLECKEIVFVDELALNGLYLLDYTEKDFWEEMQPIIFDKKILDIIRKW